MRPHTCYLVCATPRTGSTLLCEALISTGLGGHPREYFEALRHSGLPRRPREYFTGLDNAEILDLLGDYSTLDTLARRYANGEEYVRISTRCSRRGRPPTASSPPRSCGATCTTSSATCARSRPTGTCPCPSCWPPSSPTCVTST